MKFGGAVFLLVGIVCVGAFSLVHAHHAININTADKETLDSLTGIGEVIAQRIIDYRTANGPFTTIEDIMLVSGIGQTTFNNIKDHITVGTPPVQQEEDEDTSGTVEENSETEDNQEQADEGTQSNTPLPPVSSYVSPPLVTLFADAGGDRTVIVGADTVFRARAYNRSQEIVEQVRFSWNLGDGVVQEGQSIQHHFSYPGRYVVVLSIAQNHSAASDRIIVNAEPARLAFNVHADGSVSIRNDSGRDLDLSRWIITSFMRSFQLPEGTYILASETLRIPQKTLGFFSTDSKAELQYPNGTTAFRAGESAAPPPPVASVPALRTPSPSRPVSAAPVAVSILSTAVNGEQVDAMLEEAEASLPEASLGTSTARVAAVGAARGDSWWLLGALIIAVLAGGSAVFLRRSKEDGWDIIEER